MVRIFIGMLAALLVSACETGHVEGFSPTAAGPAPHFTATPSPAPTGFVTTSLALGTSVYHLESFVSGLGIAGRGPAPNANVIISQLNTDIDEVWTFAASAQLSGTYRITNPILGLCVTATAPNGGAASALAALACDNADARQLWLVGGDANGVTFKQAENDLCVAAQKSASGTSVSIGLAVCDAGVEQVWHLAAVTTAVAHGDVEFYAVPTNQIIAASMDMLVPAMPLAGARVNDSLFLWPGLQPVEQSPTYRPLELGVIQPVLSWGNSCAPTAQPAAFSSWWISGQYVGAPVVDGTYSCFTGDAMSVNTNDVLHIDMVLDGNVWTQTITDNNAQKSVSFSYSLGGQQLTRLLFFIEEYSIKPVSDVIFKNVTWQVAQADPMFCVPMDYGVNDWLTTPHASVDMRTCTVDKITLRADGVAATTPNR